MPSLGAPGRPRRDPARSTRVDRGAHRAAGTVLMLGNYLPSLAAARSLSAAGYRVIAGDGGEFSTVGHSRHCHEVWEHPPVRDHAGFVAALVAFLERRREVSVVLPLQERYVALLAVEGHRLPAHTAIASPAPEVVLTCLDKARIHAVAREAGVPLRPTALARDLPALVSHARDIGFPCVIRPTGETGALLPGDRKAIICRDLDGLIRTLDPWPNGHAALMVQHLVAGPRHNVAFAAEGGRVVALVQTMTPRTDRLDGTGLGVEGISVAPDARLTRACDALVEHLRYTGVGLAQFLVPAREEPHFLELNPRLGMSLALVQDLGLDLARAAVGLATGDGAWRPAREISYPSGRRSAWTTGDLHALRMARRGGQLGPKASSVWLARIARAGIRADVHQTWSARDPMPTLAILAQWLPAGPWTRVPLRDRPLMGAAPSESAPASGRPAVGHVIPIHGKGADAMPVANRVTIPSAVTRPAAVRSSRTGPRAIPIESDDDARRDANALQPGGPAGAASRR